MALIPMFPSPESAAGRAGVETGLMYDRLGQAEMRRMQGMGINPASARFNGLRQALALKKAAAVSGAKTRAANQARESAFSRIMHLAALGQRGLLLPQTATRVPGTGSSSVGRGSRMIRPVGMGLGAWNSLNQPPAPQAPAKPAAQQPAQPAQPQAAAAPVAAQPPPALVPTAPAAPRPVLRPPARFGTGIYLGGRELPTEDRQPGIYLGGVRQGAKPEAPDVSRFTAALRQITERENRPMDESESIPRDAVSLLGEGGRKLAWSDFPLSDMMKPESQAITYDLGSW